MSGRPPLRLSLAVSGLRHHQALLDGTVTVPGVEFQPVPPAGDHAARFKGMCRDLAYDVCELSVMSYYTARQYGLPISAIPVVPVHQFHHKDFLKNVHAGIESPADLAGKRVGTRTYTVTPGVLDRGILSQEFGLDLDTVTWVLAEEEHVAKVAEHYPANIVPGRNENLFPRLASGDLDAGIAGSNLRRQQSPDVVPLFPNAAELDRAQYQRTGIVPAFTIIAVKSAALEEHSWLTEALYDVFIAARGYGLEPNCDVAEIVEGDPVPVGLTANRRSFEELLALGRQQHILDGALSVDELFPALG